MSENASTRNSRLPAPKSGLKPPQINVGNTVKRQIDAVSNSSSASGSIPKRQKTNISNLTKSSALSRSMVQIQRTKGGSSTMLPPIANMTGRPSTIAGNYVSGRAKMSAPPSINKSAVASSRHAMSDRTNGHTKALNDPTLEKQPKKKKPAAWDYKGRLEASEQLSKELVDRLSNLENQNQNLNNVVQEKETVVVQNQKETEDLSSKVSQLTDESSTLKRRLEKSEEEFSEQLRSKNRLIEDLEYSKSSAYRRITSLDDELASKQAEVAGLKTTVAELTSSSAGMEARLKTTQHSLQNAQTHVKELETITESQNSKIQTYQEKQTAYETERRKLHNNILELKGNIRVFCRVRPFLPEDAKKCDSKSLNCQIRHIAFTGDKALEMLRAADNPGCTSTSVSGKSEKFPFEFDHVFTDQASQESIFEEVSQLVQSSIDGYNVCIFAYGQTGSGKTYTMEGIDDDRQRGIISRTISKIFEETCSLVEKGWSYNITANFVEIYNEEIRDLLATEKGLKHEIKRVDAKSNEIYVTNLMTENVTNGHNIDQLLRRAKKARAVATTNCNERSSRSHSVFILKIQGVNAKTGENCTGSLNLVDLAGSERLKDSGSTGQRLEETKNINTSLSSLSKVIMALANNKDGHIPYRDSKLTHLLMNSLGGNSKTLMFVNLSPREESFNESLNSLRFAKKVNQCQIGTASKKIGHPV